MDHTRTRSARAALVRFAGLAAAALLLAFGVSGCARYDQLVDLDQQAEARWADVEAQLQRRHDLVPNLVATVKGSAAHEEKTLKEVTDARADASRIHLTADDLTDPEKMAAFEKAQGRLGDALSRLLVVQEQYPDLKANAQYHALMVQLEGTENRLLRAREQYNEAVRAYNAELSKIGGMAINKITGKPFKPRVFFHASAGSQEAPEVKF